jgi:hypothetical protein
MGGGPSVLKIGGSGDLFDHYAKPRHYGAMKPATESPEDVTPQVNPDDHRHSTVVEILYQPPQAATIALTHICNVSLI